MRYQFIIIGFVVGNRVSDDFLLYKRLQWDGVMMKICDESYECVRVQVDGFGDCIVVVWRDDQVMFMNQSLDGCFKRRRVVDKEWIFCVVQIDFDIGFVNFVFNVIQYFVDNS